MNNSIKSRVRQKPIVCNSVVPCADNKMYCCGHKDTYLCVTIVSSMTRSYYHPEVGETRREEESEQGVSRSEEVKEGAE